MASTFATDCTKLTSSSENVRRPADAAKSSSRYAKDVVSRSLERLTERVREVRSRTTIHETEETNLHELAYGPKSPVLQLAHVEMSS